MTKYFWDLVRVALNIKEGKEEVNARMMHGSGLNGLWILALPGRDGHFVRHAVFEFSSPCDWNVVPNRAVGSAGEGMRKS